MPRSRHIPFAWLALLVAVPLGLLAVLAALGLRAQERLAWDRAEEQAVRGARSVAGLLAAELERRVEPVAEFPDPPVPGSPGPADQVLDGEDVAALVALRDDLEAGTSPAGLPRRVLAALRLQEIGAADQDAEALVALVVAEAPSVLTERALEVVGRAESRGAVLWREMVKARELLRERPDGGWFPEAGGFLWVGNREEGPAFVSSSEVAAALHEARAAGDPSLEFRLSLGGDPPRSDAAPLFLAAAPVAFGGGLQVEAWLPSEDAVMAPVRRERLWTLSLLGVCIAVSGGGLAMIQRTLSRERKLNEMKSQFVASVSHELRAPVASIRLMAEALEARKVGPDRAAEFHRLIAREGARLSTLVGNVLDHARIEQGRREWRMRPCDLASLVRDTIEVMRPLARERNIELRAEAGPVEASVDEEAIQQALVNLLDNAIKFSPADGTIEVTLQKYENPRNWELRVADRGPGIPERERERVFERFYRRGDELRRETQGTGIGLSLVKSIAEAHGGTASVEPRPGGGSVFILRIPISS